MTQFKLLISCSLTTLFFNVSAQDLENGLVGYFPLNGDNTDHSTLNLDGTNSTSDYITGYQNLPETALHFESTDFVDCSTNNRNITNQFSLSVWFRTQSNITSSLLNKYDYTVDRGYLLAVYNGKIQLAGRNMSGAFISAEGVTTVNDGNWHHCVATCTGNTWKVYIDCEIEDIATSSAPSPSFTNNESFRMGFYEGNAPSDNRFFTGDLDEVRLYNRVLTSQEIAMLCSTTLGISENSLSASFYPNPASDFITVSFKGERSAYKLYDAQGKAVRSAFVSPNDEISLEDLESGVYLFELVTDQGMLINRIIKQ